MSLFYILVEFSCGQLPWRRVTDKEAAGRMKEDFDHTNLLRHLPGPQFHEFLDELQNLDYFTDPNYGLLRSILLECMEYNGVNDDDPFDWELPTVCTSSTSTQQTPEKATANMPGYFLLLHMLVCR